MLVKFLPALWRHQVMQTLALKFLYRITMEPGKSRVHHEQFVVGRITDGPAPWDFL